MTQTKTQATEQAGYSIVTVENPEELQELFKDKNSKVSAVRPMSDGYTPTYYKFINGKMRAIDGVTHTIFACAEIEMFLFPSIWYLVSIRAHYTVRRQYVKRRRIESKLIEGKKALW